MRGTDTPFSGPLLPPRFIPAYAGTVRAGARSVRPIRLIPAYAGNRLCEAHDGGALPVHPPRMRGTDVARPGHPWISRFIPAYAGNSGEHPGTSSAIAVHPRVCGEQVVLRQYGGQLVGSSPRMRGTDEGRSLQTCQRRFIPAYAGNRKASTMEAQPWSGSSPRMRGTEPTRPRSHRQMRFIPAYAGNSSTYLSLPFLKPVHPRVCGEQGPRAVLD